VENELSRRRLLAGTAILGGVSAIAVPTEAAAAVSGRANVSTTPAAGNGSVPPFGGATVMPGDPRYPDLVDSWNGRFVGSPDYVRVVGTTGQVEQALAEAVSAGKRVAARSGGHCLEAFWANPEIRVEIDLSTMNGIYFDPARNAFTVEPGTALRDVTNTLFINWGVTLPVGICPDVCAGGHFSGGGYGVLARRAGVVPDHMYAVEVVTVDKSGVPRTVVATRDANDPNQDLFWAHTGGGGGNFGIVTKYWMRTPGAIGTDPSGLLPKPPAKARVVTFIWPWADLNQQNFTQIVKGYSLWHVANSAPGSPYIRLYAQLSCLHVDSSPVIPLTVMVNPDEPDSDNLLNDFVSAVVTPVSPAAVRSETEYTWLQFTEAFSEPDAGNMVGLRTKSKGSYLRESYTDAQLATMFAYLTMKNINSPLAGVLFSGYGGQVNAVAPDATAVAQRDSVMKLIHTVFWSDPSQDDTYLGWARQFYQALYATTGGVPTLNGIADGSYINYADVDLENPTWNKSGIPWSALYYKDNYPRLQEVKAKWDPRNVFHHALSIQSPP
jgi:aclacinomycin oxidase